MPETGAAEVAEIWLSAHRRISSLLLYPETRAALARVRHTGRVSPRRAVAARRRIEALWAGIDRIEVSELLAARAGDLADEHRLRAYDAVHLASLEHVGDPETVFVSSDRDLLAAARSIGFATVRPLG